MSESSGRSLRLGAAAGTGVAGTSGCPTTVAVLVARAVSRSTTFISGGPVPERFAMAALLPWRLGLRPTNAGATMPRQAAAGNRGTLSHGHSEPTPPPDTRDARA